MKEILNTGLAQMGLTPPPDAVEKLERYAHLLVEQNKVMNLTAITEPAQIATLHFLDSAAVLTWSGGKAPAEGGTWLAGKRLADVGTGAGFPAMVLKLLEPSLKLTLVDSLGKRVKWLESVCAELGLDDVTCIHARAEELALEVDYRDSFDVVTSRAVAAYPLLAELCLPYVKQGGVFLALKSVDSGDEVRAGEGAVKKLGGKLGAAEDYTIPHTEVVHRLVPAFKVSATPKGLPRSWGKIKKTAL